MKTRPIEACWPALGVVFAVGLGAAPSASWAELAVAETAGTLVVTDGSAPVLTYHKAEVPPPEGEDPLFARSGIIHPLHAPSGGVLTGIHPADHIHHLGLWHAWVNTRHGAEEVDFWNLKKGQGTVRFAETVELVEGAGSAGFVVRQEHVKFGAGGGEPAVVLDERFTVVVRKAEGGAYLVDYTTAQKNVTETALELPAYRYGGCFAYRSPAGWDKENSGYLTDLGKTRDDSHATRAKWCAMWGPTDKGVATIAVLCHPDNHDAPQRVRTWDDGKVFFNYVPIQETAWSVGPGTTATMRYRLVVSDGEPDAGTIGRQWEEFGAGEK